MEPNNWRDSLIEAVDRLENDASELRREAAKLRALNAMPKIEAGDYMCWQRGNYTICVPGLLAEIVAAGVKTLADRQCDVVCRLLQKLHNVKPIPEEGGE